MTISDTRTWPVDSLLYMQVMQQGPLSSSTVLAPPETLVHASMLAGAPAAASPTVGDAAPDFALLAAGGSTLTLRDFAGRPFVLAFSRAVTPAMMCPFTKRALIELKDTFEDFTALGVEMVVVCPTTPEAAEQIRAELGLSWPVYVDPRWEAFTAYGSGHLLYAPFQMYAVIDGAGIVRWLWRPEDDRSAQDPAGVLNMPLPSEVLTVSRQLLDL